MADTNFKFNLDALLNLKPGDTSELEKYIKGIKIPLDIKAAAFQAAQSSAIKTQTQALEGTLKAVSRIFSSSLPNGNSAAKLDTAARSVNKLVTALASVPGKLGGSATRSVATAASNIDKLVAILDTLPTTVRTVTSSVNTLKTAAEGLKTAASGAAPPPPPPPPRTPSPKDSSDSGDGGSSGRTNLDRAIARLVGKLDGLADSIKKAGDSITASAASAAAASAAQNASSTSAAAAGPRPAVSSTDPFIYKEGNATRTAATLLARKRGRSHAGQVGVSDVRELNEVLEGLQREAKQVPTNDLQTALERFAKLPAHLAKYSNTLRELFEDSSKTVQEKVTEVRRIIQEIKKGTIVEQGTEFANKFNTAFKQLGNATTVALTGQMQEQVRAADRALRDAAARGAPADEYDELKKKFANISTQALDVQRAGAPRGGSPGPYTGPEGLALPGADILNVGGSRGLGKVGREIKRSIDTIVHGTEDEVEDFKRKFNLVKTEPVALAMEFLESQILTSGNSMKTLRESVAAAGRVLAEDGIANEELKVLRQVLTTTSTQLQRGALPDRFSAQLQQKIFTQGNTKSKVGANAVSSAAFGGVGDNLGTLDLSSFKTGNDLAKELYKQLDAARLPVERLDEEIQVVIRNLKALKNVDPIDEIKLRDAAKQFSALAQERGRVSAVRTGSDAPLSLFGADGITNKLSSEVVKSLQGVQALRQPAEIVNKIFDELKGSATDVRKQIAALAVDLTRAKGAKLEGLDPENLRAAAQAVRQISSGLQKNSVPQGATRDQAFTQLARTVAEKRSELQSKLASGQRAAPISFQFSVPDSATGGMKKLDLTIKNTTDSYGRLALVAKSAGTVLASRTDLQTAVRRVALWGTASGLLYGALSVLRSGLTTITEVETGVIKVGKVIQRSSADFSSFRREVLDTANAITNTFGTSIESVLQTMFTFAQQGLKLPDISSASQVTALAENVTSLDAPKAAEALTAAFKQFGFEVSQSERILDSWNEVANRTAVTEDVLADAVKKAGTAARGAGVDFDSFNGLVSAIGSATRQTGKEIGTSLRFIFQRLTRPAAATALKQIGVDASDAAGNFRGFLPIITDLSKVWGTLSQSQRLAVAQSAAGIRQYNTFLVIMERFNEFVSASAISTDSAGSAMRENQEVMKSAVKQWSLFKEQVKQTAVQLGSVFLPAAKFVLGGITALTAGFNALPASIQAFVGGFGLLGVAALRVGDRLDGVLSTMSALPGASVGLFSSISAGARTIGAGKSLDSLGDAATALVKDNPFRAATIQVGDFSKNAVKSLSTSAEGVYLANSALRSLGNTTTETANKMSKFSVAVRAVDKSTGAAVLGVADMNSFFSKLGLTAARLGQRFAGIGLAIATTVPIIGQVFGKLTAAQGAALTANAGFTASMGGLALGITAVVAVVYGLYSAYKAVTESGLEAADKLKKPIAVMEEQLNVARKAQGQLRAFEDAQKRIEAARASSPAKAAEQRSQGTYKPPELESLALARAQTDILPSLGAAAVDVVVGFDDMGNALLRADSGMKNFNSSAVSVLATGLAIKKTQAAAAVATEIVGASMFKTARTVDKYNDANTRLVSGLKAYTAVTSSLPNVGAFDKSSATKRFRRSIAESSKEVSKYSAELKVAEFRLNALVDSYDKDTPAEFFQTLGDSEGGSKVLAALASAANSKLVPALGKAADASDILNRLLLRTKTRLKDVGAIGEVTLAKFAAKKVDPLPFDAGNVELIRDQIKKGARDFENAFLVFRLPGEDKLSQARLLIDEEGKLIVERFNRAGRLVRDEASKFINSGISDAKVLSPGKLARRVGEEIDKVKQIVTGAGAGTAFSGQINLGARLDLDLTPQQRVAKELPDLFRQASKAQRDYNTALRTFKEITKNSEQATVGLSSSLRKAAADLNVSSFVLRLATDVQQLGIESEKAAYKLQTADIGRSVDDFLAQFAVGAERGVVQSRNFKPTATTGELTAAQKFNRDFGQQIDKLTSNKDASKQQATQIKATQRLAADLPALFTQFRASLGKLGTPDDVISLVRNIQASGDAKTALEKTLQSKAFAQREQQLKLTGRTATATEQTAKGLGTLTKLLLYGTADQKTIDATKQELKQKQADKASQTAISASLSNSMQSFFGPAALSSIEERLIAQADAAQSGPRRISGKTSQDTPQVLAAAIKEAVSRGDASPSSIKEIASLVREDARAAPGLALTNGLVDSVKFGFATVLSSIGLGKRGSARAAYNAVQGDSAAYSQATQAVMFVNSPGFEGAIKKAIQAGISARPDSLKVGGTTTVNTGQAVDALEKKFRSMLGGVIQLQKANAALSATLDSFNAEVASSAFSVQTFAHTLDTSLRTIKSQLTGKDIDRKLAGPLAGALKGLVTSSPNVGKAQEDLSPLERLQKTFGGIFRAVEDFQSVIRPESLRVLKSLGTEITKNEERLATIRRDKTEIGVRASLAISSALDKEKAIRDRLTRVIQTSNSEIGRFAESARRLLILEDVKKKIEGLVSTLEIASRISFDTSSIDRALGKSAFSVQPAQFGQKGTDLNKFQQREEQLKSQLEQGVTADQYRNIQRELEKLKFDKKEVGITEAQAKEREKLSTEVNAGKQALQVLAQAERRGAPVGNLIEVLKSELASAGDVKEVGGKKYFQGLPSLQNLSAEISKLQEGNTKATLENQRKITLGPLEDLTRTANSDLAKIRENTAAFTAFTDSKRPASPLDGNFFDEAVKAVAGSSDPLVTTLDKLAVSAGDVSEAFDKLVKSIPEMVANALKGTAKSDAVPSLPIDFSAPVKKALGGIVHGPSGVDQVPAMLTSGEFVLPRTAVRSLSSSYGQGALSALRSGKLPGYAKGGLILKENGWYDENGNFVSPKGRTLAEGPLNGEGVAGVKTLHDPTQVSDGRSLLSAGFSYKPSAYPGGGYGGPEGTGSSYVGVSKGGRIVLSNSEDSDLFDSSRIAVPPSAVGGNKTNDFEEAVTKAKSGYIKYQEAVRKGFSSLQEYTAATEADKIAAGVGAASIDRALNNPALLEYSAEKSARLAASQQKSISELVSQVGSPQDVAVVDPARARSQFTKEGAIALQAIGGKGASILADVGQLRKSLGGITFGQSGNPLLRGLYDRQVEAGTLASSITLPSHSPEEGAFVSLKGVRYKVPYKEALRAKLALLNVKEKILEFQRSQSRFEENPTLNRLSIANDNSGVGGAGEVNDFVTSLLKRVVGSVGAGLVGGGNKLSDEFAAKGVQPISPEGIAKSFAIGASSVFTAPIKAAEGVGALSAKTYSEFDLSSKEKALNTLTNASLLGLTGAGALQAGGGLFSLAKSLPSVPGRLGAALSAAKGNINQGFVKPTGSGLLDSIKQNLAGNPSAKTGPGLLDSIKQNLAGNPSAKSVLQAGEYTGPTVTLPSGAIIPKKFVTSGAVDPLKQPAGGIDISFRAPPRKANFIDRLLGRDAPGGFIDGKRYKFTLEETKAFWEAQSAIRKAQPVTRPPTAPRAGELRSIADGGQSGLNKFFDTPGNFEKLAAEMLAAGQRKLRAAPPVASVEAPAARAASSIQSASAPKSSVTGGVQKVEGAGSPALRARIARANAEAPGEVRYAPRLSIDDIVGTRFAGGSSPFSSSILSEHRALGLQGGPRSILAGPELPNAAAAHLNAPESLINLSAGDLLKRLALARELRKQARLAQVQARVQGNSNLTYASGGRIYGNGSPTADDIPIMASAGEYVVNARAAKSLGLAKLEYMNKVGKLPKFATGGDISGRESMGVDTDAISSAIASAIDEAGSRFAEKLNSLDLQLKAPSSEELTLKIPDTKSSGGPGAARLEAVEGSIDVLRTEMQSMSQNVTGSLEVLKSESQTDLNERISNVLNDLRAEIDSRMFNQISELRSEVVSVEAIARQASSSASDALSRAMR